MHPKGGRRNRVSGTSSDRGGHSDLEDFRDSAFRQALEMILKPLVSDRFPKPEVPIGGIIEFWPYRN